MTRGNQREIDRQRAAARHAGKGEAKEGDFLSRKVVQFNSCKKIKSVILSTLMSLITPTVWFDSFDLLNSSFVFGYFGNNFHSIL